MVRTILDRAYVAIAKNGSKSEGKVLHRILSNIERDGKSYQVYKNESLSAINKWKNQIEKKYNVDIWYSHWVARVGKSQAEITVESDESGETHNFSFTVRW